MTDKENPITSLKMLQTCFESEHFAALFTGEGTHDPALRFVGQIIRFSQDESLISDLVASGLPEDYLEMPSAKTKNTLEEVPGFVKSAVAKGFHEPKGAEKKGAEVDTIFDLLGEQRNLELFHDAMKRTYISYKDEGGGIVTHRLSSSAAQYWVKGVYYKKTGEPIAPHNFNGFLDVLHAKALYDGPQKDVFLRVAYYDNRVIINLADKDRRVVVIDREGIQVTKDSPVIFVNSSTMQPLPAPEPTENALQQLQDLWGVSDENFSLLLLFMVSILSARGPYLSLLVEGEQGSGKSLLCSMVKGLIDPSQPSRLRFPKDERDLMIAAQESFLPMFDNLSNIRSEMSDALCSLSTGAGFATRKLYFNDELQVFNESRPYIMNGIDDYANRPDMLDRAVSINLPAMDEEQRKTEAEIKRRYESLRPGVLYKLCEIVSCALRRFDEVKSLHPRMADAAQWIVAGEPATGLPEGTLLRSLKDCQAEAMAERMDNNPVAVALRELVQNSPHYSSVSELFRILKLDDSVAYDRSFPKTAQHLSKKLKQLRPALQKFGINVDFPARDKEGQKVVIWMEGCGSVEAALRLAAEKEKNRKF